MLLTTTWSRREFDWRLAFALAALGLATGCSDLVEGGSDPVGPVSAEAAVAGRVVSSATGAPVSGAEVSIGDRSATTGPDGRFELTRLLPGPAKLRCLARGFEDFETDLVLPTGNIDIDVALRVPPPGPPGPLVDSATYDLTAHVRGFDPAWGDQTGARYTAVVTLPQDLGDHFGGTFFEWRYINGAEKYDLGSGIASGHRNSEGDIVIEVERIGIEFSWSMRGSVQPSGHIAGTWGCCGHMSGTLEALRRQGP